MAEALQRTGWEDESGRAEFHVGTLPDGPDDYEFQVDLPEGHALPVAVVIRRENGRIHVRLRQKVTP